MTITYDDVIRELRDYADSVNDDVSKRSNFHQYNAGGDEAGSTSPVIDEIAKVIVGYEPLAVEWALALHLTTIIKRN